MKQHTRGFSLCVRPSGQLLDVLFDSEVLGSTDGVHTFAGLLAAGAQAKGFDLLRSAHENGARFGVELVVGAGIQTTIVDCNAIKLPSGDLMIVGTVTADLRTKSKDKQQNEEIMRVLGEISMMQREVESDYAKLQRDLAERQRLVAMTAHDLRNAMNTIVLNASLALDTARQHLLPEDVQSLDDIVRSGESVSRLLADLMTITQPDTEGTIAIGPVDLQLLAENVVRSLRGVAGAKGVQLEVHRTQSLEPAPADEHAIQRVLENLVGNAIKYGESGTTVRIEVHVEDQHLVTHVIDDGPGIDPRVLPHLFGAFTRHTRGASRDGSGLGLAICKRLVEAHGGWIRGTSDGKAGTTFRFGLPLASEATPAPS